MKITDKNDVVLYEDENDNIHSTVMAATASGAILFGADLCGAILRGADLRGADLRGADLTSANLTSADLRGANLRGVNLSGAELWCADLRGAHLTGTTYGEGVPMEQTPVYVGGLRWDVLILDKHMKIGCELHFLTEWASFPDSTIAKMHSEALEFWHAHKHALFAIARAAGRMPECPTAVENGEGGSAIATRGGTRE